MYISITQPNHRDLSLIRPFLLLVSVSRSAARKKNMEQNMCKHPNYSPIAIRFQRPRCLTQTFMYVRILLIKTGEGICDMSRRTLSLSLSLSLTFYFCFSRAISLPPPFPHVYAPHSCRPHGLISHQSAPGEPLHGASRVRTTRTSFLIAVSPSSSSSNAWRRRPLLARFLFSFSSSRAARMFLSLFPFCFNSRAAIKGEMTGALDTLRGGMICDAENRRRPLPRQSVGRRCAYTR